MTSRELRELLYQQASGDAVVFIEGPDGTAAELRGFDLTGDRGAVILKSVASDYEKDDIV